MPKDLRAAFLKKKKKPAKPQIALLGSIFIVKRSDPPSQVYIARHYFQAQLGGRL
jgi:hypothetical protein